ncbi:Glucan endo-1,3-alpha-glucosidase agn1, partial [Termitomyces sp. T112]
VNGRVMVSSFEGKCLKQVGWQKIKSEVGAYLMPFISGLEGQFWQWGVLDTWFCWGCAWPSGNIDKTMADDHYYISQLGSRYGTTVSPWLFTHYDYKNFLHKSDDWLYLTRWNQLMAMRDQLTFVEVISW